MEKIFQRFKDVVGTDNFYGAPEILEVYSKDHSFVPPRKPLAVVKPKNTDEIKEIINLANETHVTLIPTSSGFPKFHGGTIPSLPGVVVDLSGLDKILRVDRRNKVAVIEPGVTFGKLREAVEGEGMVPYTPLLPRSTKSVVSSYLEREPITIPKDHWDYNDPLAAGQVIIGDGHIQGFGDTSGHSKKEVEKGEAVPVMPMGPSGIGWLTMIQGAQGTLGIVPWASVRCRLKPSIQEPFFIAVQNLKDALPFLQKMLRLRFVEELFILNGFGLANALFEETEKIERVRTALPPWVVFINIAGYKRHPKDEVAWKEEQVKEAAMEFGLELRDALDGMSAAGLLRVMEKTTDKDLRLRFKDSCQVLLFSTTLDKTPDLAASVVRIAAEYRYSSTDVIIYIQPVIQGCQCQCEVVYPYNPQDNREVEKVKDLYRATAQGLSTIGAYYSRPYGILGGTPFRDTGEVNILQKIKGILDPNDIMNSGKLY